MIIEGLSIKTTSVCQRLCKYCSVLPWMRNNPGYHMDVADIESLVEMSHKHGLEWGYILLSGGEPLLWKNLKEGVRKLNAGKITKNITLLTNALAVRRQNVDDFAEVVENVNYFKISRYADQQQAISIDIIRGRYGNTGKILVEDRMERLVPPSKPISFEGSADCACRAYSVVMGKIDSCGPSRTIVADRFVRPGLQTAGEPKYTIGIDCFYNYFITNPKDRFNIEECKWCVANRKIWPSLNRLIE